MKKLPVIEDSWRDIYELSKKKVQGDILIAAINWHLFDLMREPCPVSVIAEKRQLNQRNLELFLNCLAGMDLIKKDRGLFSNTQKSNAFLVSSSPSYIGTFLNFMDAWHGHFAANLEVLVTHGPSAGQTVHTMSDPSVWAKSARDSAACQFGAAQNMTEIVRCMPEFPGMRKMLDLGGGAGFYTIGIISAHPTMQGVVFDQPAVATVARETIKAYGAEDRVSVMAGDYKTDTFGGGYDLVFASATLNFVKGSLHDICRKIYDSLNPGGVFIAHQDGITHDRTKPVYHVADTLASEMMGMDLLLPRGMVADAMLESGFTSVRSFPIESNTGDMDVDIARK